MGRGRRSSDGSPTGSAAAGGQLKEAGGPHPALRSVSGAPLRYGQVLGKLLYWLAVLIVSLALLVALILFLEARDESSIQTGAALAGA